MRLGFVRNDLSPIYLQDVENTSQRDASLQAKGQSRYFRKPTDAELTAVLNATAFLSARGSNTAATVDTTSNRTLRIRVGASDAYTVIQVTANAALAKTTIVAELNAAFTTAGLPFVASVKGTNQLQIDTKGTNAGPSARLQIDTVGNGSTLSTAVGYAAGGVSLSGLAVSALKTAVYPTSTTINVASATIVALSTFASLTAGQQASIVNAVADLVAPKLAETGPVLRSFAYGTISKLVSSGFQPGGARIGLPIGPACAAVADDGSTPFVLP